MLQYRAFQNHPGIQLPYLLLGIGNKYSKCPQLKFTKGRVISAITTNSLKATHNFFLFGGLSDCSSGALSIHPQLKPGHSFSYVPFDNGIRFSSPNCKAFSKRYFSQIPRVKNGNERTGVNAGARATNSSISATEDVNAVTSTSEQLAGDGVKGAKLGSSTTRSSVSKTKQNSNVAEKQKQQSRSKKKKEQLSATVALEQASVEESSESASQAKSSKSKNGQSPDLTSEKTSLWSSPEQSFTRSALTKQQSKKESGNSGRKKKSAKRSNGSLQRQAPEEMVMVPRGQNTQKQLYPPTGKSVVVVESVTKAKVIQGYLGGMYEVLPSYGHVRDLAARSGSVRPDDDFSVVWEVPSAAWTHLKSIKIALSGIFLFCLPGPQSRKSYPCIRS